MLRALPGDYGNLPPVRLRTRLLILLVVRLLGRLRSHLGGRLPARLRARATHKIRVPPAAVVALAGAAAALGMDGGPSSSSQPAAKRASFALPAQVAALRVSEVHRRATPRAAAAYYRRTVRKRVAQSAPTGFLPLYREAARRYGVNWRLLASIHRQETAFSTAESTYHGLNAFGCCAGPMQFNVTNGPVSTWRRYRQAFRAGRRPERYPHRTRHHPSIYDDFDAIMAAARLLSDSGAGRSLDHAAWWAAYSYYGHDLFGITYASQVLARALTWQRDGFCPNCALDAKLVEELDATYGEPVRRELTGAESKDKKKKKKKKKRKKRKGDRRDRERSASDSKDRASRRSRPRPPASKPPRTDKKAPADPAPPPPAQAPPDEPPAVTPPPPPPPSCSPLAKLLGCG